MSTFITEYKLPEDFEPYNAYERVPKNIFPANIAFLEQFWLEIASEGRISELFVIKNGLTSLKDLDFAEHRMLLEAKLIRMGVFTSINQVEFYILKEAFNFAYLYLEKTLQEQARIRKITFQALEKEFAENS